MVKLKPFTEDMCIEQSPAPITEIDSFNSAGNALTLNRFGPMGDIPFLSSSNYNINKELEDKIRSYIELSVPIVNSIITDANNNIAIKLLNLTKSKFTEIMEGQILYDTYEDCYILSKDAQQNVSYLFCGEIIERIIQSYDIKDNIIQETKLIITNKFYTKKESKLEPVVVRYTSENGNILPNYQLELNFLSSHKVSIDEMIHWFKYNYIVNNPESKLTVLLRIKKDTLNSIISRTVRVIPRGLRPIIDGRNDSLTVLYSNVLRANNALKKIVKTEQPIIYALKYRDLQSATDALMSYTQGQRENKNRRNEKAKQRKSIFERTSTKYGHIRSKALKKIQNGSGRSVVIAGPDISVDEVGIPEEMLKKSMEYHLRIKNNNTSLKEVCEKIPVVMNRAPTLHLLSKRGYKVKMIQGNAIKMHTLSASGFNFDHDGGATRSIVKSYRA